MQNVGLIYVSLVKPNDIGLFNSLNSLSSKQMSLLAAETSLSIDETSIQIYGKGKDEEDTDFIGGTFLSTVTIDSTSIHASEIGDIFNSLISVDKQVEISNPSQDQMFIVIRPGASISESDKVNITRIIKETSSSFEIKDIIDTLMCDISVDVNSAPIYTNQSFSASNKNANETQVEPTNIETGIDYEKIGSYVFKLLKEDMLKEGTELNSLICEIRSNRENLERALVDSVLVSVKSKLDALPSIPTEPVNKPGIEYSHPTLDGLISKTNFTEEGMETTIYDKQIKLSDLIGGCENETDLFNKVLENKDNMSRDELVNMTQFDMFLSLTKNETKKLTPREKMMREIKLSVK